MSKLLEVMPFPLGFNLIDMSNGEKYTSEENDVELTPALAESDLKTDEAYDKHFKKSSVSKRKAGKGKFKVEKTELNVEKEQIQSKDKSEEQERDER